MYFLDVISWRVRSTSHGEVRHPLTHTRRDGGGGGAVMAKVIWGLETNAHKSKGELFGAPLISRDKTFTFHGVICRKQFCSC